MSNVVLLGASGSIGTQTLEVLDLYHEEFCLKAVSVGKNTAFLRELVQRYPSLEAVYSIEKDEELAAAHPQLRYFCGDELSELAAWPRTDLVINALVGFVGFLPSLAAIRSGKDLALANKETLVAGGEVIKREMKKYGTKLYPIDSEHSAIWQCLQGNPREDLKRLIITASGGSFRDKTREELKDVTLEDALKHPTWSMGAKITIDSATMMNKAFEVMEAHYLFDVPYEQIDVLIHPQSIVHSLIEFKDGAQLAQLGLPDMRIPILYALRHPSHAAGVSSESLDLAKVGTLQFRAMDYDRFPFLKAVKRIAPLGGNFGAVLNGANDEAVSLFLQKKISFLDIEKSVFAALEKMEFVSDPDEADIIAAHDFGRDAVARMWQ